MIGLQLLGNAMLLWLAYYWLGIGEATEGQILWSTLLALTIAAAVCWLQGAAFVYFRDANRGIRKALSAALRHVLPLLLAGAALIGIYVLLSQCDGWSGRPAFRIASYLTMKLRKPVKPSSVLRWFTAAIWVVRWIVVPVLALPAVAGIAERGWAGFREFGARARHWRYWIATPVLVLLAFDVPFRLFAWVPRTGTFGMEMTSFVARFASGYLLFAGAWLALVWITSAGTPRFAKTAESR